MARWPRGGPSPGDEQRAIRRAIWRGADRAIGRANGGDLAHLVEGRTAPGVGAHQARAVRPGRVQVQRPRLALGDLVSLPARPRRARPEDHVGLARRVDPQAHLDGALWRDQLRAERPDGRGRAGLTPTQRGSAGTFPQTAAGGATRAGVMRHTRARVRRPPRVASGRAREPGPARHRRGRLRPGDLPRPRAAVGAPRTPGAPGHRCSPPSALRPRAGVPGAGPAAPACQGTVRTNRANRRGGDRANRPC